MSDFTLTQFVSVRSPTTGRWPSILHTMLRTYLTRQSLPELTARELADVGLSSSAALAEAARLPWDVTPNPRRPNSGIVGRLQHMLERARSRRLLARLEARELRDFGVSPTDAQFEANKPFWRE